MGIEHIRISTTSSGIPFPILFALKWTHVPTNTIDLFRSELKELLNKNYTGITMPRKNHISCMCKGSVFLLGVQFCLTIVMQHTNNAGRSQSFPIQIKVMCIVHQLRCYSKRMIKKTTLIVAMMRSSCRSSEASIILKLLKQSCVVWCRHQVFEQVNTILQRSVASWLIFHKLPSEIV